MLADGIKIDYFVLVDKSKPERLQISGLVDYEPLAKACGIPIITRTSILLTQQRIASFLSGMNLR